MVDKNLETCLTLELNLKADSPQINFEITKQQLGDDKVSSEVS